MFMMDLLKEPWLLPHSSISAWFYGFCCIPVFVRVNRKREMLKRATVTVTGEGEFTLETKEPAAISASR